MTEHSHPQVKVDDQGTTADAALAPLVAMVIRHGLTVTDSCQGGATGETIELAWLWFPHPPDALEFLLHTGHHTGYQTPDSIALTVHGPSGPELSPSARVTWLPSLTPTITTAWREGLIPDET